MTRSDQRVRQLRPDQPDSGIVRVTASFSDDEIDVGAVFAELFDRLGPAKCAEVLEAGARLARSQLPAEVA